MEIQQLKYFYTIAQYGSLTKAAEKLHISQPSLSRSLHALEEELGTPLFDRVGRNIVLNSAGQIALERTISVLNSAEAVKHDVENYVRDQSRSVDVYIPVPMGDTEKIIVNFKRQYPEINLRVASNPSESLSSYPPPNITFFASPLVHKAHNYLLLGEEDIVVATSLNHPLAHEKSVQLASLSSETFVRVLPSSLYSITSHMFTEAGFRPNTIIEDQDFNHILAFVANDFGITLAPRITWFGRWKDEIARIPISDVHRKRYLYLKWPENAILSWATLRFREYIVNYFNKTYGFTCGL